MGWVGVGCGGWWGVWGCGDGVWGWGGGEGGVGGGGGGVGGGGVMDPFVQ